MFDIFSSIIMKYQQFFLPENTFDTEKIHTMVKQIHSLLCSESRTYF